MDAAEMKKVVDDFFAAMNAHDAEAMGRCCTPGVVADEVAEPENFEGVEALVECYRELFQGYPDCSCRVLEWFADGPNIICLCLWKATNSGAFRGSEPTNKPVELRIAYFFRFQGEKIDRITEFYDLATLLVQQGQLEL